MYGIKDGIMNIPVVFATDENYLFYTIVAITSMAENANKDTYYEIYVLISGKLKTGHSLFSDVQKRYANIEIQLVPVNEEAFENVFLNNSHVTKATFYRLLLSEMLPLNKCLYLDSDIIVNIDLQELYVTDMKTEYVAGVRDLWVDLLTEIDREQRRKRTGISSMDQYINAGVLLMNLDSIRKDDITEAFYEHMKINYLFEDQDIINVCCYEHIKRLPAKWNLFTLFMGQLDELQKHGTDENTIKYMKEKKGIIHYATPFIRPWESERFLCNDIWWNYAILWSQTSEYQKLKKSMQQREIGYSESNIISYCAKHDKVYIWGFTELGRKIFSMLLAGGSNNVVCFFDNDAEKQKFTYCGIKVVPFDIKDYTPEKSAIIIACQKSGKEIQKMLLRKGICEEDIVIYIYKDPIYYQCLRPEFREGEEDHA